MKRGHRQNHSKLKNLTNYENFYLDNNNIISYIIKMDGIEERKVKKKDKIKNIKRLAYQKGKYAHKKSEYFTKIFSYSGASVCNATGGPESYRC